MPLPLFETILSWQRFDIKKAKKEFAALSDENPLSLEQRMQAIVEHHYNNSPFYKQLLNDPYVSWSTLPIITKNDLQQPLQQRLAKNYHVKNIYIGATSGSSGHPFTFAKDKQAHAMAWAAFSNAYQQYDISLNTSLQARLYGIPKSGIGKYKELVKDFVSNRIRFPIFKMNDIVLKGFIEQFKQHKFEYINGYCSCIVLLARYCKGKQLVLKSICPTLKVAIVTSEMLFPEDRLLLEEWLGIPVINEYGASEVGLIAMQNTRSNFEINTRNIYVEVVDDMDNILPDGEIGRLLVTDLFNKAHAMIRYEIGDLASVTTLKDGTRIINNLQGRTNDIAILPSGKIVPGLTFYYVTKVVIKNDPYLSEFVVFQKQPALFEIHYVSKKELDHTIKQKVLAAINEYLEPGLQVHFIRCDQVDRSKTGKLKQFVSEVHNAIKR